MVDQKQTQTPADERRYLVQFDMNYEFYMRGEKAAFRKPIAEALCRLPIGGPYFASMLGPVTSDEGPTPLQGTDAVLSSIAASLAKIAEHGAAPAPVVKKG